MGAHPAEGRVLPAGQPAGQGPDQHHEEGQEGGCQEEDEARHPVPREDEGEHAQRHEAGQGELGQVLAEVGVQRLDAFDGGVGQLAGTLPAGVGGAESEEVSGEPVAEVLLDSTSRTPGGHFGSPHQAGPGECQHQENGHPGQHLAQGVVLEEDEAHHAAEGASLPDGDDACQKAEEDCQKQCPANQARLAQETVIKFRGKSALPRRTGRAHARPVWSSC